MTVVSTTEMCVCEEEPKTTSEKPRFADTKYGFLPTGFRISAVLTLALAVLLYWYQVSDSSWQEEPFIETQFAQREITADVTKQGAVIKAFKHAWSAYERNAMGCDEYNPLTKKGTNLTDSGGIGYTIIDALDTMQIMNLHEEYDRARQWIATDLTFDRDGNYNTFEITIRILGGLLSAYHLSSDELFLSKATDLADRILPAFDTTSGLPLSFVNLATYEGVDDPNVPGLVSTSEVSTLQLEFRYLSYVADNVEYWDKAERVMVVLKNALSPSSPAPVYLSVLNGKFLASEIRLGSRGDSFYEYLLKQYLQTNKTEPMYLEMYQDMMQAIQQSLVRKAPTQGLTYIAELLPWQSHGKINWSVSPKQDHLVCFFPGSLMLGAVRTGMRGAHVSRPPKMPELNKVARDEWILGEEILKTCVEIHQTATGLSPEIVHFYTADDVDKHGHNRDWYIKNNEDKARPSYDARYILRPETIESLFIAYRLTGDEAYREQGWKIFEAIEKYCKLKGGGYASVANVDDVNTKRLDKMESFFLSETLKYLYLLFSDDTLIPLDQYVFNTEAHPLPIFTPSTTKRSSFGRAFW